MENQSDLPLPERVRPRTFQEVLGQERIWSQTTALYKLVTQDAYHSLIFWGPPGTGKTSLAEVIGQVSARPVRRLSAVEAGVKDIRSIIEESQELKTAGEKNILLFLDELHRLSKSQQDVLLPALERGTIKFIGATTENPSFSVNAAILSRSLAFQFMPLDVLGLRKIIDQALRKLGKDPEFYAAKILEKIAQTASGDARRALHLVDAMLKIYPEKNDGLNASELEQIYRDLSLRYDKSGDQHYDVISAFIKSIRASQPDAAVYYLARMLEGGERPEFIARRLVIAASEDLGNASPSALLIANAALQSCLQIGLPEARIILAQATTYLASCPKSNKSYLAIEKATEDVKNFGALDVPLALMNAPTKFMKEHGRGKDYVYAHDDIMRSLDMVYLPPEIAKQIYYEPTENGSEKTLKDYLEQLKKIRKSDRN